MTWPEEVVAHLLVLKRNGWTFDRAWAATIVEIPPRGREFRGMPREMTLFDAAAEPDPVAWLRWACDDSWHGRNPGLANLTVDLMDGDRLESQPPVRKKPVLA